MEFTGQVWFSFGSSDVWVFYRFVRAVAEAGGRVGLEWTPLPGTGEDVAMATYSGLPTPADRGVFLHAMLGKVHLDGGDPADPGTVSAALEAAGLGEAELSDTGLEETARMARDLGVTGVPSLFRHGPVTRITLNPAALQGDVLARASRLLAFADDDGIWEMAKP